MRSRSVASNDSRSISAMILSISRPVAIRAGQKVGLFWGQANGDSFTLHLARPLVVGTVEARRRSLAGTAGLAAGHEAFQQGATAKVADLAEGALEGLVILRKIFFHGQRA